MTTFVIPSSQSKSTLKSKPTISKTTLPKPRHFIPLKSILFDIISSYRAQFINNHLYGRGWQINTALLEEPILQDGVRDVLYGRDPIYMTGEAINAPRHYNPLTTLLAPHNHLYKPVENFQNPHIHGKILDEESKLAGQQSMTNQNNNNNNNNNDFSTIHTVDGSLTFAIHSRSPLRPDSIVNAQSGQQKQFFEAENDPYQTNQVIYNKKNQIPTHQQTPHFEGNLSANQTINFNQDHNLSHSQAGVFSAIGLTSQNYGSGMLMHGYNSIHQNNFPNSNGSSEQANIGTNTSILKLPQTGSFYFDHGRD
jgi:hypothetical protein